MGVGMAEGVPVGVEDGEGTRKVYAAVGYDDGRDEGYDVVGGGGLGVGGSVALLLLQNWNSSTNAAAAGRNGDDTYSSVNVTAERGVLDGRSIASSNAKLPDTDNKSWLPVIEMITELHVNGRL